MREAHWTRRELLVRTGWVAAGTTVLSACGSWLPVLPTRDKPTLETACVWVQALPDGTIRLQCPRAEMGQGVATGCAQIVAEELRVPRERLELVYPDTDQIDPVIMTVGSWSILEFFEPLSRGAAALRETLRARAAEGAGVPISRVKDAEEGFLLPDGTRKGYGELVPEYAEVIEADPAANVTQMRASLRNQLESIGQSWKPLGIEAIVTGREVYSRDVVVPDMVYGALAHPPQLTASLVRVDVAAARRAPEVIDVVVDLERDLAGVVCRTPFALAGALEALAPAWQGGELGSLDQQDLASALSVERALADDDLEHTIDSAGDLELGAARAEQRLSASYESPFLAHAAMEPRAGVVSVKDGRVEAWTASQDPWLVQGRVARITGRSRDDVVVHVHRLGGSFGGRSACQATEEAAWLASAVGRPVRVQWTREDEFRLNYFMPTFSHRIEAGLDADGRISDWQHDFVSSPIIFTSALVSDRWHWLLDIPSDPGTKRNAIPPYWLPHRRIRYSDVRIAVPTGAWRGLGAAPNTFAVESAIDELAHLAGADPLEFRLDHLGPEHARLARVLQAAARRAGWGRDLRKGRGLGIAGSVYKDETYVGIVAEVTVDGGGAIRIERMFCAHDCGLVINPDQVRAQIEGNIAFACSMVLHERTELASGQMAAGNFHEYPVLRQSEMPEVVVDLVENKSERPVGAGEPAIAPAPAAIANAVFAASGRRLRSLPLRASEA